MDAPIVKRVLLLYEHLRLLSGLGRRRFACPTMLMVHPCCCLALRETSGKPTIESCDVIWLHEKRRRHPPTKVSKSATGNSKYDGFNRVEMFCLQCICECFGNQEICSLRMQVKAPASGLNPSVKTQSKYNVGPSSFFCPTESCDAEDRILDGMEWQHLRSHAGSG